MTPAEQRASHYTAKRQDRAYLGEDWNAGDRDVDVRCHRQWIAVNRKAYSCVGNSAGQRHEVPAGERMLVQSALIEGRWGGYRLCLKCCDEWLDQLEGLS